MCQISEPFSAIDMAADAHTNIAFTTVRLGDGALSIRQRIMGRFEMSAGRRTRFQDAENKNKRR